MSKKRKRKSKSSAHLFQKKKRQRFSPDSIEARSLIAAFKKGADAEWEKAEWVSKWFDAGYVPSEIATFVTFNAGVLVRPGAIKRYIVMWRRFGSLGPKWLTRDYGTITKLLTHTQWLVGADARANGEKTKMGAAGFTEARAADRLIEGGFLENHRWNSKSGALAFKETKTAITKSFNEKAKTQFRFDRMTWPAISALRRISKLTNDRTVSPEQAAKAIAAIAEQLDQTSAEVAKIKEDLVARRRR